MVIFNVHIQIFFCPFIDLLLVTILNLALCTIFAILFNQFFKEIKRICYMYTSFYCALQTININIIPDIVFFTKLNVCSNHVLCRSVSAIVPAAFAHFVSLCHILAILIVFQAFSLSLYLL